MKILAICPRVPAKNKSGDQVLAFNRLRFLAEKNQVEVICFGHKSKDILTLQALGIKVNIIQWRLRSFIWPFFKALLQSSIPYQCAFYTSREFANTLSEKILELDPDFVYSVTVRPLLNFKNEDKSLVVDLVDSLGLNFQRRTNTARGIKKILYGIEARRISLYERQIARQSNISFVVSAFDRNYIGENKIQVLPLGIEFPQFSENFPSNLEPKIVFSGNMFYEPNVEAVLWFVKNCWPIIKSFNKNVRFIIAGRNPASSIVELASDSRITITGCVKSMQEILSLCHIAIAPMRSGSGMQFKILEGMASKLPVVVSTIGLGDIKALDNDQLLVRDDPVDFAGSVVGLLDDDDYRRRIGESGYRYVRGNHDWRKINEKFLEYSNQSLIN
jgi:glycosyltransferase involved in cell wall biosynthesis